ncbi:hypothetical protein JCM10207_008716 [Rhodosporidiobolus poonsookiae]
MPSSWTEDDDLALRGALERGDGQKSWTTIAKDAFPDGKFTKQDCVDRWKILSKPKPIKGPWTLKEDEQLRALVTRYGSEKWVMISSEIGTRSGKQCRERWHNHLDPTINKSEWTPEEEALVKELHARMGPRWAEMSKHLPGRPDNSIKNYWNAMQAREKREKSRSFPSFAPFDKSKAMKAKAAASAAAAAVTAHAASGIDPASPAPTMSRSASSTSLNNSRFSPYVRSSPMTKSRSESVSSLSAFTPLHASSSLETIDSSLALQGSPYTPSHMARSQSISAFGAPHDRLPRYPSLHALPRDLNKEMVDPGDATEVLSSASLSGQPLRRPHANSSPPMPSGLHAWAQTATPSPPSTCTPLYQPMQQVEVLDAWGNPQQQQTMVINQAGRMVPVLTPLQIGSHVVGPASGFSSYEASPQMSSVAYDSRFASPADLVDPQQHQFMSGAGPLVFDHQALQHSMSQGSLQESPQPRSAYGTPYIHPSHLVTLDEQATADYSPAPSGDVLVDEYGNVVAPAGVGASGVPSSRDSGYEPSWRHHSHHGSMDSSAFDHASDLVYSQPQQTYYDPSLPVELPQENGVRPNLLRRDTAPPAFHHAPEGEAFTYPSFPAYEPAPYAQQPSSGSAMLQSGSLSSSLSASTVGPTLAHHRHTPSLPNPPTGYSPHSAADYRSAPGSASATLPSSATFPGSAPLTASTSSTSSPHPLPRTRPRASSRVQHLRQSPSVGSRGLQAPIDLSAPLGGGGAGAYIALSQPPNSTASLAGLGIGASPPAATGGMHSEPMSKVYSSPMSEIAGRWEGMRLDPSATSAAGEAAWLPRSAAAVSLGELAGAVHSPAPLEHDSAGDAWGLASALSASTSSSVNLDMGGAGSGSVSPAALALSPQVVPVSGGGSASSPLAMPLPGSHPGSAAPSPAPSSATSASHPTTGLMSVDQHGRATLPL